MGLVLHRDETCEIKPFTRANRAFKCYFWNNPSRQVCGIVNLTQLNGVEGYIFPFHEGRNRK